MNLSPHLCYKLKDLFGSVLASVTILLKVFQTRARTVIFDLCRNKTSVILAEIKHGWNKSSVCLDFLKLLTVLQSVGTMWRKGHEPKKRKAIILELIVIHYLILIAFLVKNILHGHFYSAISPALCSTVPQYIEDILEDTNRPEFNLWSVNTDHTLKWRCENERLALNRELKRITHDTDSSTSETNGVFSDLTDTVPFINKCSPCRNNRQKQTPRIKKNIYYNKKKKQNILKILLFKEGLIHITKNWYSISFFPLYMDLFALVWGNKIFSTEASLSKNNILKLLFIL